MSYMLSLSEQTKLNAFLSGILDDYKTGVITQIQAVGKIGNVFEPPRVSWRVFYL
ncbi:hypothetical protein BvCmsNSNP041_01906 [Escherichia coli]|nr:hypothetical protein BvCmsNSNP041_01906 [Escherichia coli]GDS25166.1 hypothetical protein BvCmsSINP024_02010 [Escherichia coli]GDU66865.1 hypothetical protein BvCmsSIP042_02003 [Escherichia coli]GDV33269.1 hypothetical protein BvCmsSIP010_03545 [Escherichia coli]